jgi:hypothetical protein
MMQQPWYQILFRYWRDYIDNLESSDYKCKKICRFFRWNKRISLLNNQLENETDHSNKKGKAAGWILVEFKTDRLPVWFWRRQAKIDRITEWVILIKRHSLLKYKVGLYLRQSYEILDTFSWHTYYLQYSVLIKQWNSALKNLNNCLNINIYSYLKTSGGQSSILYLNAVHFFNTSVN